MKITTMLLCFTILHNINLVEIEATLLEEERKTKARKGGFAHVKEEEALFTQNKFKGKYNYKTSHVTTMRCGFYGKPSHMEKDCYTKKRIFANLVEAQVVFGEGVDVPLCCRSQCGDP